MSKFNTKSEYSTRVQNKEGAVAYTVDKETELYTLVVTSMFADKFYESENEQVVRLRKLINACEPSFVAKLAVYARESMYLRTMPVVLTVELNKALHARGQPTKIVESLSTRVIQRVDEITEMLSYYAIANADNMKTNADGSTKKLCKLSKALQRGIGQAFTKFDEYQLAKYNRKGAVTLKDALFLTHAKPTNKEQEVLFKKLVNDELEVPYTWEVELSTAAEKGKTKTQVWEELIDSNKLGYMALMRNLRNILEANVSKEHVIKVASYLESKEAVQKSKQLPFRFFSAYKQLAPNTSRGYFGQTVTNSLENANPAHTKIILEALETAVMHATDNIESFGYEDQVAVVCDVSASMQTPVSKKSSVQMYHIGLLMGMCVQQKCKYVETGLFGDTYKAYPLPKNNILSNTIALESREGEVGYSTNGHKVLQNYIENKKQFDKIMIFTDCQMWDSGYTDTHIQAVWTKYKAMYPNAKLYLFDLQGYGNTPIDVRQNDVYLIAGWSEKVFDVLKALENKTSAVEQIKNNIKL